MAESGADDTAGAIVVAWPRSGEAGRRRLDRALIGLEAALAEQRAAMAAWRGTVAELQDAWRGLGCAMQRHETGLGALASGIGALHETLCGGAA